MKHLNLDISPGAYLFAALGVLLLPLNWLIFAVMAALIHEFGHLAALKSCHVRILSIEAGAFGAKITTGPMTPQQEMICAAMGPLCSLLLLLFVDVAPVLSLIGLVHGLFNLLPVYPMDGGRILKATYEMNREKRPI